MTSRFLPPSLLLVDLCNGLRRGRVAGTRVDGRHSAGTRVADKVAADTAAIESASIGTREGARVCGDGTAGPVRRAGVVTAIGRIAIQVDGTIATSTAAILPTACFVKVTVATTTATPLRLRIITSYALAPALVRIAASIRQACAANGAANVSIRT